MVIFDLHNLFDDVVGKLCVNWRESRILFLGVRMRGKHVFLDRVRDERGLIPAASFVHGRAVKARRARAMID